MAHLLTFLISGWLHDWETTVTTTGHFAKITTEPSEFQLPGTSGPHTHTPAQPHRERGRRAARCARAESEPETEGEGELEESESQPPPSQDSAIPQQSP